MESALQDYEREMVTTKAPLNKWLDQKQLHHETAMNQLQVLQQHVVALGNAFQHPKVIYYIHLHIKCIFSARGPCINTRRPCLCFVRALEYVADHTHQ